MDGYNCLIWNICLFLEDRRKLYASVLKGVVGVYGMTVALTPNFDELKDVCGSDDLKDCFKFLFIQEDTQNEGFIREVAEWSNGLRAKMVKFVEMIEEGQTFNQHDVAAMDGLECLNEAQRTIEEILEAVGALLNVLRIARAEKRRHVMVMEVHD